MEKETIRISFEWPEWAEKKGLQVQAISHDQYIALWRDGECGSNELPCPENQKTQGIYYRKATYKGKPCIIRQICTSQVFEHKVLYCA